jgi:hypothetical protein
MTEFEMLEYIQHWAIVNMDAEGNVDAYQLRKQIYSIQSKFPAFGYDIPDGVFE